VFSSTSRKVKSVAQMTAKGPIKQVSARVPLEMAKALDHCATDDETTIQAVVYQLVEQYLRDRGVYPRKPAQGNIQGERAAQSA